MRFLFKYLLLYSLIFVISKINAENTAGSMLDVDPNFFNHSNLIQLTWQAEISEYDYIPSSPHPFRIRMEFNSVGFKGVDGVCFVGAMIQNVGHTFTNDIVGTNFSDPQTISTFPAVGLYLSSLHLDWADSEHGVELLLDSNVYPKFGRVFENVDNLGGSGKNIYTRENVGSPSIAEPIIVRWTITKIATVTNPQGNYSKNLNGDWVPLIGTFVIWNFNIDINGIAYNVANYYLPINRAEFLISDIPLRLHQEYFGAKEGILGAQKNTVKYTDIRASDGINWYNMEDWNIVWRIDDEGGNLDNRFGWKTDGTTLTSRAGHTEDNNECKRDVGDSFHFNFQANNEQSQVLSENFDSATWPPTGGTQSIANANNTWTLGNVTDNNGVVLPYPNSQSSAICMWDANVAQNEWLFSPQFALPNGTASLEFYSGYSTAWLAAATMSLWISTDSGQNWTKIWEAVNDGQGWVWRKQELDLSAYSGNQNVWLSWRYVGQNGDIVGLDGVKLISNGTVGIEKENNKPNTFSLEQNYPNPFNPITTINFQIPFESHVTIMIYDIMGREISTILDKPMIGGYHDVKWNGRDKSGQVVGGGIYFYKILAGDFVQTKKMLLLK